MSAKKGVIGILTGGGDVPGLNPAIRAVTAAQRTRDFTCDYVGQTPMAKGYGTLPMYHVRRSAVAAWL